MPNLHVNRRICLATLLTSGAACVGVRRLSLALAKDETPAHPFLDNVKVTVTDTHYVVESDGIPNHKTAVYPNANNPNRILKQSYTFKIPRFPKRAAETTPLPMGPIGVAINGIPLYNPYNREGRDAVTGPYAEVFDSCCGHPDPRGRYHYHKYPVCVRSPFKDSEGKHSPLIGYAFDGYAVHGPNDANGKPPEDLDDCNGHADDDRGYHYHVTADFPYILGAYRGEVEYENFDRPRGGPNGPAGPGNFAPRGGPPGPGGFPGPPNGPPRFPPPRRPPPR